MSKKSALSAVLNIPRKKACKASDSAISALIAKRIFKAVPDQAAWKKKYGMNLSGNVKP